MYAVAVLALILTLLDDIVHWHEALLLVLMYTLYILGKTFIPNYPSPSPSKSEVFDPQTRGSACGLSMRFLYER